MAADDGLDIDLIAASLRADTGDLGTFVEALATKLEEAVPGTQVQRRRAGLLGPRRVSRVSVDASGERFELSIDGGRIATRCARLSGGIVLKSEVLETDAWLAALSRALADEARSSESARQSLERLLNR